MNIGWTKLRWGISNFWISGQSLIKENCPNSSTSDDIDMKLGPVTKLDKGNNKRQKNIDDVMSENCDVIVFFGFMANLEQSGSRIPDQQSAKLIFSLMVNFYLTKTESRTKKSLKQLSCFRAVSPHTVALSKGTIFAKKC